MVWLAVFGMAEAREFALNPAVTSIDIDDALTMGPYEIDLSRPDYVLEMEFINRTDAPLHLENLTCGRGATSTLVSGPKGQSLDLSAGEARQVQLLCDHGALASGSPWLMIDAISSPSGDRFCNVVWRMNEEDILANRQREGRQLATGEYDRVTAPVAVASFAPPAPVQPSDLAHAPRPP
ncbi:MAG: hypothetical protein ABMB14_37385, partial [Myxococcota bacterium]